MLDPLKEKLIAQAKAELEKLMWGAPVVDGKPPMIEADFMAHLLQSKQSGADRIYDRTRSAVSHASHTPARVRVSPTVAADYQARNVFPDLRPPIGEAPGRYFVDHEVSWAVAQAVFDDAVEQAARGGSLERRSLTLAYRALARRASAEFGYTWNRHDPCTACPDPADFQEQAPIVDALLRTVSQPPDGKPRRRQKRSR